jgi:hypothetical protein
VVTAIARIFPALICGSISGSVSNMACTWLSISAGSDSLVPL